MDCPRYHLVLLVDLIGRPFSRRLLQKENRSFQIGDLKSPIIKLCEELSNQGDNYHLNTKNSSLTAASC